MNTLTRIPAWLGKKILLLPALLVLLVLPADTMGAAPEFFVFDNGVGRGSWTPEQQAKTLKELGFDGISYNYTQPELLAAQQKAFQEQGLKIYALYIYTYLDKPERFPPRFKEAIKLLKGTDTVIWMTLRETAVKGGYDAQAVRNVQEMADLAAEQGVRVAVYGHVGMYDETGADAARIVKLAGRTNAFASINLCHEFLSGKGAELDETLKVAAPISILASINGADVAGKKYILRLDEGDFDVVTYLNKLFAAGYTGPVGLQCYSVKGDVTENLKADIAAWKKMLPRIQKPDARP
jgi:sugar phosphate isomerase/epimerase